MATIQWRLEAVRDIDRLRDFLYSKDTKAATTAMSVIYSAVSRLESTPQIGRPMQDGTKRRELIVPLGAGAYVIRYVLENKNVYILRLWHNRESKTT